MKGAFMRAEGRLRRLRMRTGFTALAVAALTTGGVIAAAKAPAAPTVTKWGGGHLSISKEFFGTTTEPYTGKPTPTFRYTMTNARGMKIQLLSYGATTQTIYVPGRHGHVKDVVLGFATLADYVKFDSPPVAPTTGVYFGQTIGRYGNRIAKGTFQLKQPDGKLHTYTLQINNGPNSLHGEVIGFGNHIWSQVGSLIHTNNEVGV